MKKTFLSFFLLTALFSLVFAKETKNIKEHMVVKGRHFIVCDDYTIWQLAPIKTKNRSIVEWLWSNPVHEVDPSFEIDLNNFPLPRYLIIQEKPLNISEIENHVDSESIKNIDYCSHLVNLYDTNINKWVFAKAYDLFSFVKYINDLSQEDYEEGYNKGYKECQKHNNKNYEEGYNVGYYKGLVQGTKVDNSGNYNKGYDYGYKLGYNDGLNDGAKVN